MISAMDVDLNGVIVFTVRGVVRYDCAEITVYTGSRSRRQEHEYKEEDEGGGHHH